ncbi:MAG: helix-turn-helix domain-containing protein [Bdellovibrionales bacterium]|nr:helix-turn-helix domain-containing protein [Bdellovibrionales bacterium]
MSGYEVKIKKKILAEIEKEMEAKGISQGELGRQLDIARHHVNAYLRGRNLSLSFERIFEMADVVGLEIDVTVKRKGRK